jgi:ribulose-phosphate 3-epimerase
MIQIVPTILEKQFNFAEEKIALVKDDFKWIQVDIIDGIFAEGKTFELELLNKMNFETDNILWNMHLMVKEPIKWIEKCIFAGASRIIGQVEMMENKEDFVKEVQNAGLEAGLAFDIDTEITKIPQDTDEVLLLSRKAGFGPYKFDKKVLEKIERLKKYRSENEMDFIISADGGINVENIGLLKGIENAYCGSAIFNGMVKENINKLKSAIN